MKHLVLLLAILNAAPFLAQESEHVKIVTTGQIRKLDAKKKVFELMITLDAMPPQRSNRGGGRGGRGGRGGFPGGQPQGRGGQEPIPVVESKVFVTDRTTFSNGDFDKLRIGQRVTVTGIHKGKSETDIEALEIAFPPQP